MKKILLLIIFLFVSVLGAECNQSKLPYTKASDCIKTYNLPSEHLFWRTLASINANKFSVKTVQSRSGYIVFEVGQKEFLANIVQADAGSSLIKVTPVDNSYYFSSNIVNNLFNYITQNLNEPLQGLVMENKR